jgi:hypothetical protein
MLAVEESAQAYTVRSVKLEIRFRHVGDRWQHSISIRHRGESLPLMGSDEGSPVDEVPPSPALQDLRLERLSADVVEFQLLGQAGKGIYSAAVQFDGAAQSIDFDFCSRRRAAESQLCIASRYALTRGLESRIALHGDVLVVEMAPAESAVHLSPVAISDQPATRCRLVAAGPVARIVAGCVETTRVDFTNKKGANVRWRYRIGVTDLLEFRH